MTDSKITLPRHGASLIVLALLGGCSFIPAYERPAAPVPQRFAGVAGVTASSVPPWRTYFADPALHVLIAAALDNNRDLRIALARVEEARALAGIARADRFPGVDAKGSASRSRTPGDLNGTGHARTSSRYDLGVGVPAFELDFWGRVAALNEAARARYLASEEAARSFRLSLVGDVASTWFQLNELAERERLAQETLKSREESRDLIRRRQDAGLATDLDLLAAESLAESVRAQWAELKRQRMQTENALDLLTGMTAARPRAANVSNQPAMAELAPGLPSEALLRRPDVRAAEQRLRTEFATETSVENAIRHLLEISELRYRTFPMIRHHIGGFEPNELRRLLVRSGAVRFMAADGTELWALIERVSDDFRYSRWKHKDTPLNQPAPSELFPGSFKDPSQY